MMTTVSWTDLPDDALMDLKISSLGLSVAGTEIESWIGQWRGELTAKGLVFQPPCFVGDEWFVPVGIPAIAIPFFLVHPRLRDLERRTMLEVEGETRDTFLKLIRHETGHAFMYAYRLARRPKWKRLFGETSTEDTPSTYRPRPYSRSFVVHLDDWYAQAHPDEDFAETFAVWLTPGLDWRARYADWKALDKLEYVDELMRDMGATKPLVEPVFRARNYACLDLKLKTYYARKKKMYAEDFPDFFDRDLRRLFEATTADASSLPASRFLRAHRRRIVGAVATWTSARKYTVHHLLQDLMTRCDRLGLRLRVDDPASQWHVAAYLTSLVANYLFTGKFKRTK
jgi:hypothetical protein